MSYIPVKRSLNYFISVALCLLAMSFLFLNFSYAKEIRLYGGRADIEIIFTFDEEVISEEFLRTFTDIHPMIYKLTYTVTYQPELCIDKDEAYFKCGSRDIHDANFFNNAKVNLSKSGVDLHYLETLPHIKELRPLVNYFQQCIRFGMWKNESLLNFYQTWDIQHLESRYDDIDASTVASEAIHAINSSESYEEKYKLARKMWGNSVNRYFRKRIGKLPREAWEDFLKAYNIEEEIFYKEIY